MDIPNPTSLKIDHASQSLIAELDDLTDVIKKYRPLSDAIVRKLLSDLLVERVHESSAIEGNPASWRETQEILATGQILSVGRKRENLETLQLGKAIQLIQAGVEGQRSFSDPDLFLEVHKVLLTDWRDDAAGRFRHERVQLSGAKHQPPRDVAEPTQRVFDLLKSSGQSVHPIVLASWAHWAIARIHPFLDGNGRMARLWQDFILLRRELTPAIIPQAMRKDYYAALQLADDGNFSALIQLVAQSAVSTARLYVNAIRESDEAASWAAALIGEADELAGDRLKLEYSHWVNRVTELRDAFSRCVVLLNRNATRIQFQIFDYPLIDRATWESLRSETKAGDTWAFRVVASNDHRRFKYVFFAGRHFQNFDLQNEMLTEGPQVCILASELPHGETESLMLNQDNSNLTFRSVLVIDNEFVRKRWDASLHKVVFDKNITALKIAQDFLTEIVRHRLVS